MRTETQQERMVRLPEVKFLSGLPKNSIYRLMAAGDFPSPVQLSAYSIAWRHSEIEGWIASRPKLNAMVPNEN